MIYITGDIHGSPERLGMHSFYEQKEMTRDDIVIICGDFGMVWEESGESASEQYWLKWLEDKPFTTVFVCGNHENFDRLYQYPVKEWHGGKVHEIRPHVLHLMRGEIFDIEGLKFFAFGGQAAMISEMVLLIRQKMKTGVRQLKNGIKPGKCIVSKGFHGGNRSFQHKRKWIMVSKILNVLAIKWIILSHIHHLQV